MAAYMNWKALIARSKFWGPLLTEINLSTSSEPFNKSENKKLRNSYPLAGDLHYHEQKRNNFITLTKHQFKILSSDFVPSIFFFGYSCHVTATCRQLIGT
jgi:hypothetical protein